MQWTLDSPCAHIWKILLWRNSRLKWAEKWFWKTKATTTTKWKYSCLWFSFSFINEMNGKKTVWQGAIEDEILSIRMLTIYRKREISIYEEPAPKRCASNLFCFFFHLTEDDHWSTSPTSVAQTFDFIYYIDDVENARQISLLTCFFFFNFWKMVFFSGSFVVVSNKWWIYLEARMYPSSLYQSTLSLSFFLFLAQTKLFLVKSLELVIPYLILNRSQHTKTQFSIDNKKKKWKIFAQNFRSTWQKRN